MRYVRSILHLARCVSSVALTLACFSTVVSAQSLPPGTGRYGTARVLKTNTKATASPTVNLLAAGTPAVVTPSSLAPFTAMVNTDSVAQTLRITNSSSSDSYDIVLDALSGADFADFRVTPCANSTLKPNDECDLNVTYHPNAAGTSSATIELTANNLTTGASQPISVPVSGKSSSTCTPPNHDLLPLSHADVTNTQINCYYSTTNNYAFVNQVHYLYNPGGNANTVSSDLASLQFPFGFQLALEGNANTSSCSTGASSGSNSSSGTGSVSSGSGTNSSCGSSSSGSSTPSLSQDVLAITKGGDFALKGSWPILNWRPGPAQFMAYTSPRAGFSINGLAGQNTATNATNVDWFVPFEEYFQLNAIPPKDGGDSPGSIYVDYRGGWEHVSSQFATSAGLKSGSSFGLQQISLGLALNGGISISAQRYFGPEQAYISGSGSTVLVNNFNNWQLSVQMSPININKK